MHNSKEASEGSYADFHKAGFPTQQHCGLNDSSFGGGGCPVHCQMFSNTPGLSPPDTRDPVPKPSTQTRGPPRQPSHHQVHWRWLCPPQTKAGAVLPFAVD